MDVVDAQVAVAAESRHIRSLPARQAIFDAGDRIDDSAIERKEEQVFETWRQVPTGKRLVVRAVAGNRAVVFEALSQHGDRCYVFVLDARAVVPEVAVRFQAGRVELPLAGELPRGQAVGDGRPRWRACVEAQLRVVSLGRSDMTRVAVLVHV